MAKISLMDGDQLGRCLTFFQAYSSCHAIIWTGFSFVKHGGKGRIARLRARPPKTRSGKILRRVLRAQECGEEIGGACFLENG